MILINPWARKLRNGEENPKNYPYWKELIGKLEDNDIIQIGVEGEKPLVDDFRKNLSFKELCKLVNEAEICIGVDSFLQHLCWYLKKPCIVLWGQSDPAIFGHSENINILKDKKYLREKQFDLWEFTEYNQTRFNADAFVSPIEVINIWQIKKLRNLQN